MSAPKIPNNGQAPKLTPPLEHQDQTKWFRLGSMIGDHCAKAGIDPDEYQVEEPPRTKAEWDAFDAGKAAGAAEALKTVPAGAPEALDALASLGVAASYQEQGEALWKRLKPLALHQISAIASRLVDAGYDVSVPFEDNAFEEHTILLAVNREDEPWGPLGITFTLTESMAHEESEDGFNIDLNATLVGGGEVYRFSPYNHTPECWTKNIYELGARLNALEPWPASLAILDALKKAGIPPVMTEALATRLESGEFGTSVIDGMEKALAGDSWGSAVEDAKHVRVSLMQRDILDIMPDPKDATNQCGKPARRVALEIAAKLCIKNGVETLDELVLKAAEADGSNATERMAENFGHYVAMESLGTGCAWTDSHEGFGLKVPGTEFHVSPEELDKDGNYILDTYTTKIDAEAFCERYGVNISEIEKRGAAEEWVCSISVGDLKPHMDCLEIRMDNHDDMVPSADRILRQAISDYEDEPDAEDNPLVEVLGGDLVKHLKWCLVNEDKPHKS